MYKIYIYFALRNKSRINFFFAFFSIFHDDDIIIIIIYVVFFFVFFLFIFFFEINSDSMDDKTENMISCHHSWRKFRCSMLWRNTIDYPSGDSVVMHYVTIARLSALASNIYCVWPCDDTMTLWASFHTSEIIRTHNRPLKSDADAYNQAYAHVRHAAHRIQ